MTGNRESRIGTRDVKEVFDFRFSIFDIRPGYLDDMKKESRRSQRVADLVRSEISLLLLTEAHDPDVKTVTITEVEMPPDLKSARVYFTARGDEAALQRAGEGLARAAGYLRREVGRRCGLRYAPELFFQPDRSYERGARIDELLSEVLPEREEEP